MCSRVLCEIEKCRFINNKKKNRVLGYSLALPDSTNQFLIKSGTVFIEWHSFVQVYTR